MESNIKQPIISLKSDKDYPFNPMNVIGHKVSDAIRYFELHNIQYNFKNCNIEFCHLGIYQSYPEGTHIYKIYDYKIKNKDDAIVTHFEGVTGKPLCYVNNDVPTITINGNIFSTIGNI